MVLLQNPALGLELMVLLQDLLAESRIHGSIRRDGVIQVLKQQSAFRPSHRRQHRVVTVMLLL